MIKIALVFKDWREDWPEEFKEIRRRHGYRYQTNVPDTGDDTHVRILSTKVLTRAQAQKIFDVGAEAILESSGVRAKDYKDLLVKLAVMAAKHRKETGIER